MTATSTHTPVRHEPQLLGRPVVVIGGGMGIGLETGRRAREEGAEVILTARDPDRLRRAGPVNLIAAGFVDTALSAALLGDHLDARREQLRTTLPLRRVIGPADIAALAVHLMTSTAVTGATVDIDGGQQLVES